MTKTLLIVAYYFPPIAASGSMRALGFCRYLDRYGWQARVLTTEPKSVYPPIGVDESLCRQLPNTVQIDRVPHKNPEPALLLARDKLWDFLCKSVLFGNRRLRVGSRQNTSEEPGGIRKQYRKAMTEWLFSFPDPQCFWLRPAVQRLAQIPSKDYPDVVLATGGPWTSLLIGQTLAKKFGVPFVADFRDPWTNNPNRRPHSDLLFRKHKELEKSVCAAAAKVIANTEKLQAQFRHDNPAAEEKFITITNGFDDERWGSGSDLTNSEHHSSGAGCKPIVELCHFGSVYGNRNPVPLLLAVESLLRENRITKGQLRVRFVGDWEQVNDGRESLAKELEQTGFLKRNPSVSHDECLKQMTQAKILLILQPAYPLQVPAKIYEYIATGRPILVIGGEGATAALVERHQLGLCCPNDVSAIKQILVLLIEGKLQIPLPSQEQSEKFHYRNLTQKLSQILDAVVATKAQQVLLS